MVQSNKLHLEPPPAAVAPGIDALLLLVFLFCFFFLNVRLDDNRKRLNIDSSILVGQWGLANSFKANNWRTILYESAAPVHILAFTGLGQLKKMD